MEIEKVFIYVKTIEGIGKPRGKLKTDRWKLISVTVMQYHSVL